MTVPVIAIDGPAGSGKGTIATMVADRLGWYYLDSGALYRVLAHAARRQGLSLEAESGELQALARNLPVTFERVENETHAFLSGTDIESEIRSETAGNDASQVAAIASIREALLQRQQDFAQEPGLVADGRDMGTVVFPQAQAKIFLTASVEARARRRYKQLKDKGMDAKFPALSRELQERDERDRQRQASPTRPADDALVLDSSDLSIDEVFEQVMKYLRQQGIPAK